MGPSYKEHGGGPAVGLADDLVAFLREGLQTGSFGSVTAGQRYSGANPVQSTNNIANVLNQLLSGEAVGPIQELVSRQAERDVGQLRARFSAGGGMAFGTPAAFGEALLRSETAPKLASVLQQGQLAALQQLLPIFQNIAGRGITQREGVLTPNPIVSGIASVAPVVSAGLNYMADPYKGLREILAVSNPNPNIG